MENKIGLRHLEQRLLWITSGCFALAQPKGAMTCCRCCGVGGAIVVGVTAGGEAGEGPCPRCWTVHCCRALLEGEVVPPQGRAHGIHISSQCRLFLQHKCLSSIGRLNTNATLGFYVVSSPRRHGRGTPTEPSGNCARPRGNAERTSQLPCKVYWYDGRARWHFQGTTHGHL